MSFEAIMSGPSYQTVAKDGLPEEYPQLAGMTHDTPQC